MDLTIIAVGKLKERYWIEACAEYLKRLAPNARVEVKECADIDPAKAGGVPAALDREGAAILSAIPRSAYVVLLAIEGKPCSSEQLAAWLAKSALEGRSNIAFIIGGSQGVGLAVRERADETLSFGPVTLPHNLARVVLLEQLYRAFKINKGEPYHK